MILKKFMENFRYWTRGEVEVEDFENSPIWIRNNKKITKRLISENPDLLEFCSPAIKDNWSIVSLAVNKYPSTIEWASERIRNNLEVSKMILEKNPFCLSVVSQEIQQDEDFIKKLLIKEPEVIIMVTNENIFNDKELILKLIEKKYFLYKEIALRPIGKDEDVIMKTIQEFNKSYHIESPFYSIPKDCKKNPIIVIEALKKQDLNKDSLIFFKNEQGFNETEAFLLIEEIAYKIFENDICIPSKNLIHLVLNLNMQNKYNLDDLFLVGESNNGFIESRNFCEKIVIKKELSLMTDENKKNKSKLNKFNKF